MEDPPHSNGLLGQETRRMHSEETQFRPEQGSTEDPGSMAGAE